MRSSANDLHGRRIFMSVGKTLTRPPRGSSQSTNVKARPSGQTKVGKTSSSQSDPRQKGKDGTSAAAATSKRPTGKVKGVTYFCEFWGRHLERMGEDGRTVTDDLVVLRCGSPVGPYVLELQYSSDCIRE